jgi:outer membrane protein OmpA-like peptidoglycan-associated protein
MVRALVFVVGLVLSVACRAEVDQTDRRVESQPATDGQATEPTQAEASTIETPWWQLPPMQDVAETTVDAGPDDPVDQRLDLSSDVLFDVGSAALGPAADSQLQTVLRLLRQHPTAQVEIIGHTDSTAGPTDDFNQQLSLERARSVQTWLIESGVALERISVDGHGARQPIAPNDTEAGRAANRRVSIRVWEES